MTERLVIIFCFTCIIHLISTLSYSVRLVGIKTGRIALSFALFNILMLASRTANSLQAPLLAKVVENNLLTTLNLKIDLVFHLLIAAASLGSLIGAFLIPTFQVLLSKLVVQFNMQRSVTKLFLHSFSKIGVKFLKNNLKTPSSQNIEHFKNLNKIPKKLLLLNIIVVALLTTGSFSSMYAAFINENLRLTAGNLAPIITGISTVLLVLFIDPFFSLLTDDCLEGTCSPAYFNKCVVLMVASRFAGTVLAQLVFIPLAKLVTIIAKII